MKIIDAHSHLWLKQDTTWNGMVILSKKNGRADFLGQEVQMIPPFMIDGKNSAEIFLSNMNYAQVTASVVVQELIDGCQNDYLEEVVKAYPDRFVVCGMCDYLSAHTKENFLAEEAATLGLDDHFHTVDLADGMLEAVGAVLVHTDQRSGDM